MTDWFTETYKDRIRYGVRVTGRVCQQKSRFQNIEIFDTAQWGRVLALDGVLQTSTVEERYYHEMLVHPAALRCTPKRALVIGGGDGGSARELLRHPEVESIDMVEIDADVVSLCREHMPNLGRWDDPRLHLHFQDGRTFLSQAAPEHYDLIVVDGTDPIGHGADLFGKEFVARASRALNPDGAYVQQTGSPVIQRDEFLVALAGLRDFFPHARPYFGAAPLYSAGQWSWTLAQKRPGALDTERAARIEEGCEIFSAELAEAAFARPAWLRRLFE
jgi:spermidine synthase